MKWIDDEHINGFAEWLKSRDCKASTIRQYVHYLFLIAEEFGRNLDDLVLSEEVFKRTLAGIGQVPGWPARSRGCYKTAFRRYREFVQAKNPSRTVPENFPLVDHLGSRWHRAYAVRQESVLKELFSWLKVEPEEEGHHQWVFRGQGFSSWGLETSLGRGVYTGGGQNFGTRLKRFENESMWEFAREASKDPEFRDYKGLNLLALMQHYGCKTRLLDFSLSPLVALSMAIDQNVDDIGKAKAYRAAAQQGNDGIQDLPLALWAVDLNVLNPNRCSWRQFARQSFCDGNKIVCQGFNRCGLGISVVFPKICNPRISAQSGLFLMPNDLDGSFEANLRSALNVNSRQYYATEEFRSVDTLRGNASQGIVKFEINPTLVPQIKSMLMDANVTAKSIYPDLIGLGKYVSNMIQI